MTRRSLFGLALAPLAALVPMPAPARSFLAPGHISADPCLLVDLNQLAREAAARVNFGAYEVLVVGSVTPTIRVRGESK